jgi:hypothetical protein
MTRAGTGLRGDRGRKNTRVGSVAHLLAISDSCVAARRENHHGTVHRFRTLEALGA